MSSSRIDVSHDDDGAGRGRWGNEYVKALGWALCSQKKSFEIDVLRRHVYEITIEIPVEFEHEIDSWL